MRQLLLEESALSDVLSTGLDAAHLLWRKWKLKELNCEVGED